MFKQSQKTWYQGEYRVETTRLQEHAYNDWVYFVTICTQGRKYYLGKINEVGEPIMQLTAVGEICSQKIQQITLQWQGVKIREWCIMPNHVHLIIDCRKVSYTTHARGSLLADVVRNFKAGVKRETNKRGLDFGWQRLFHEHIIRNKEEYGVIADYIRNNVLRWQDDCHNSKNEEKWEEQKRLRNKE